MKISKLKIPFKEYDDIQNSGNLSTSSKHRLNAFLTEQGIDHAAVFGTGTTARAIKGVLRHRFWEYADSTNLETLSLLPSGVVIIATSPLHYETCYPNYPENPSSDTIASDYTVQQEY